MSSTPSANTSSGASSRTCAGSSGVQWGALTLGLVAGLVLGLIISILAPTLLSRPKLDLRDPGYQPPRGVAPESVDGQTPESQPPSDAGAAARTETTPNP